MKRKDRGKALYNPDNMPDQIQAHPYDQRTDDHKRSITGDLHVRGEMTAIPTPEETLARKSSEYKQEANDTKKRRIEYAMLGVVTIYTIFAGWQGGSTAGQLSEARKVTLSTDKNFRASQRAWIGPSYSTIYKPEAGKALVWRTVLKNGGNSPALDVRYRDAIIPVPKNISKVDAIRLFDNIPAGNNTTTIFSGQTPAIGGGQNTILSPQGVYAIETSREGILLLLTDITYKDIFGDTHETRFCTQYMPNFPEADSAATCGFGDIAN